MASRRELFKPAPGGGGGGPAGETRKPLAQGRLVNNMTQNSADALQVPFPVSGWNQSSVPSNKRKTFAVSGGLKSLSACSSVSPDKQKTLQSTVGDGTSCREQPLLSEHTLPRPATPVQILHLSESASDKADQMLPSFPNKASGDVLVVDATMDPHNPDEPVVNVTLGFEESKAMVTCHSSALIRSLNRDIFCDKEPFEQSINTLEKYLADIPLTNSTGDNIGKGETQLVINIPTGHKDEDSSDIETCSLYGLTRKEPQASFPNLPKSKKKKKGQIVPSRYMQSAKNFKRLLSNKNTSAIAKVGDKKSTMNSTQIQETSYKERCFLAGSHVPKTSGRSKDNHTPLPVSQQTSTPNKDGLPLPCIADASAITEDTSCDISKVSEPSKNLKQTIRKTGVDLSQTSKERCFRSPSVTISERKRPSRAADQLGVELKYAHYLQWLFLDSRAKNAFQQQEKEFMTQMYGLWEETNKLKEENAELERELATLVHNEMVEKFLKVQMSVLSPLSPTCDSLVENHQMLAAALETANHQVATNGIYLPKDMDHYQGELNAAFEESNRLLTLLAQKTEEKFGGTLEFSEHISSVESFIQKVIDQIEEMKQLSISTDSLFLAESSRKIQAIQSQQK